jgi:hypothetical protein
MSTAWIQHVKEYQNKHGCTYKEAMSRSKCSYVSRKCRGTLSAPTKSRMTAQKSIKRSDMVHKGGSVKSVMRKLSNTAHTVLDSAKKGRKMAQNASREVEKRQEFINFMHPELGQKVSNLNSKFTEADRLFGEGLSQTTMRKTRNTVNRVRKVGAKMAPVALMAGHPELAVGLELMGSGNKYIDAIEGGCGGGNSSGKPCYACGKKGGSFAVPSRGGSLSKSQSSLIGAMHPSFTPLKPKSVRQRQETN